MPQSLFLSRASPSYRSMLSDTVLIYLLFRTSGFLTLLLIRHTAPYKRVLTQTEFVFYSLACSVPGYLTAALLVGMLDTAAASSRASTLVLVVQGAAAALYGVAVGLVAKATWRRQVRRHTPWYGFMLNAMGQYVIVHTTSSRRYYGWVRRASDDDEPRREIVLGNPVRLGKGGSRADVGTEILFSEGEIARVAVVRFGEDPDAEPPQGIR